MKKIKRYIGYYGGKLLFLFRHIFRIVPVGGKYKFDKKYFAPRAFSNRNCMRLEAEKHAELAKKAKKGIVEIGILYGDTSKVLANANPNIPVYGIDPIIMDSMSTTLIGNEERIKNNTFSLKNFNFIKDFSYNVVKNWNKSFDYIFIDGSHIYEDVKKDFEDWFPLLEKGGIISFHDSTMYRGGMEYWPGPSHLADELIFDPRLDFVESVARLTIFRKK